MTFRNALLFLSILLVSLVGAVFPAAAEVTFSQDVAPIVFQRCTGCHRPGEAAPFSLMTYDDVGKTMKMTATFPDGTVKTLLDIQNWDFAWQDRYFFEEPIVLPKGTRLDS